MSEKISLDSSGNQSIIHSVIQGIFSIFAPSLFKRLNEQWKIILRRCPPLYFH